MGYFPNGTAGDIYYDQWCSRCLNDTNQDCHIWALHLIFNYQECNKPDSLLHELIPRSEDGLGNERCKMFRTDKPLKGEVKLSPADERFLAGQQRP